MKRLGGAPDRLGARDGRPRRRLQPRAGPAAPPQPARPRRQRRPGAGPRRRPPGRRRSPKPNAASARPPARVAATAVPFADGAAGAAASPPPPSTSPGSARRAENTDFAVQRIGLSKASCGGSTRRPTGASSPPAATMVMLSTAIYPAFSPKPAAFARADRHRRAAPAARLRRGLDHRRARHASRCGAFGGPAKAGARRGAGRHRPAPLHRPRAAAERPRRALLREAPRRRARPRATSRPRRSGCSTCAARLARLAACARSVVADRAARSKTRTPSRPAVLGRVHRRVGLGDDRVDGSSAVSVAEHRDADAGGDRSARRRARARARGSPSAIASATSRASVGVAAGQDDRELVAAEPGQHVGLPRAAAAARRRSPRSRGRRPGGRGCR